MADETARISAPGLRWRPRKGRDVPYWMPSPRAVAVGYPSGAVNLESLQTSPADLIDRCHFLQAQMSEWLAGRKQPSGEFDGTIASVIDIYQTHPESPFHHMKPGTVRPYNSYLARLRHSVGDRKVLGVTALDVQRWHQGWSKGGQHLAAGAMAASVLKAALTFCVVAGHRQCKQLRDDIRELRLPSPKRRTSFATADEVIALRKAAHTIGHPSAALCYAMQFETTLRLWDVAGQWYPLGSPVMCTVIHGNVKWAGVEWRHVGPDMILRYMPSKTERTTAAEVVLDLRFCPMVLEEMAIVPEERRTGPMIVYEGTSRPYDNNAISRTWRRARTAAGIAPTLWARDLRASAITEARAAGVSTDDTGRVAGHADGRMTAAVYDRANLEAHQRIQAARLQKRAANRPANDHKTNR